MMKMEFYICALLLLSAPIVSAEGHWYDYDHLYLQAGSYTHFGSSKDYAGPDVFVSLEAVRSDDWLYGLGLFDNSFGQFSQYLYGGKTWHFSGRFEGYHAKVTVGLVHGYKGEHKDQIPLNKLGIAPAIIPGIGYKKNRLGVDVILLGNAGLLFTAGYEF